MELFKGLLLKDCFKGTCEKQSQAAFIHFSFFSNTKTGFYRAAEGH